MEARQIVLSERLRMLARMVTPGNRVADVGCDHGFLSIYLVQRGISPGVVAMDIRKGPLSAAREHIDARGLGTYIETRLSDGLKELLPGEADTAVCAGMGGRLMERILRESREKVGELRELILQPQSELEEFRRFLREAGLRIVEEDMVREDGKYYFAMRAVPGRATGEEDAEAPGFPQRLCDRFGGKLLEGRHPGLEQYLRQQERTLEKLAETLEGQESKRAQERLCQIRPELADVRLALRRFGET